jgi:hypothetical protein
MPAVLVCSPFIKPASNELPLDLLIISDDIGFTGAVELSFSLLLLLLLLPSDMVESG